MLDLLTRLLSEGGASLTIVSKKKDRLSLTLTTRQHQVVTEREGIWDALLALEDLVEQEAANSFIKANTQ